MLIYGIWGVYFVRCELAATLEWAERGWDIVATEAEPEPRILAGRLLGESLWAMGRFDEALGWIEQALALAPAVGPLNDLRFSNDHLVTLRVFESWTLIPRGEPNRARAAVAIGLRRAKTLAHPVTLSLALSGAGHVAMMLRDVRGAANLAHHEIAVAAEHGVSTFGQWSRFQHGWAGYWSGHRASGLELMEAAFAETEATATILFRPLLLDQYAEALAREGRIDEAGRCLEKAMDVIRVTGERFYEAEVQRRRGSLFAIMGERDQAKEAFLGSLDVARSQNAALWELRAARDLASHLIDTGQPREAHDVLAPVCNRLSGRARGVDLDEAKSVLARLSAYQQV